MTVSRAVDTATPVVARRKSRILILGGTGMLGSMLVDQFAAAGRFDLVATARSDDDLARLRERYPGIEWRRFDATSACEADLRDAAEGATWAVNAIGVIKQRMSDVDATTVEQAIRVNALFPFVLTRIAERIGMTVVQIATDCVYSGSRGGCDERIPHDPLDAYGKTKSLGEARSPALRHLRCSIVGPEARGGVSLLAWFLGRPAGASVEGYVNHVWNGITSLHFARICLGIVANDVALPEVQHVLPRGETTKAALLSLFAREFGRSDVTIRPVMAPQAVNRTLGTIDPAFNDSLWKLAGYPQVPDIPEMIAELAQWSPRAAPRSQHLAIEDSLLARGRPR